jgi:hypothetical protein
MRWQVFTSDPEVEAAVADNPADERLVRDAFPPASPSSDAGEATQPLRGQHQTVEAVRRLCPTCRGTGHELTVNDLNREMLGHLPVDDPAAMDAFVVDFYLRLTELDDKKRAAEKLVLLFPKDLVTAGHDDSLSEGKLQRDVLLHALVQVLQDYDPDRWRVDRHAQELFDQFLRTNGRKHVWRRPDGVFRPASSAEFDQVNELVHVGLMMALGAEWRPEYDGSLADALGYAKTEMMWAAQHDDEGTAPHAVRESR